MKSIQEADRHILYESWEENAIKEDDSNTKDVFFKDFKKNLVNEEVNEQEEVNKQDEKNEATKDDEGMMAPVFEDITEQEEDDECVEMEVVETPQNKCTSIIMHDDKDQLKEGKKDGKKYGDTLTRLGIRANAFQLTILQSKQVNN